MKYPLLLFLSPHHRIRCPFVIYRKAPAVIKRLCELIVASLPMSHNPFLPILSATAAIVPDPPKKSAHKSPSLVQLSSMRSINVSVSALRIRYVLRKFFLPCPTAIHLSIDHGVPAQFVAIFFNTFETVRLVFPII